MVNTDGFAIPRPNSGEITKLFDALDDFSKCAEVQPDLSDHTKDYIKTTIRPMTDRMLERRDYDEFNSDDAIRLVYETLTLVNRLERVRWGSKPVQPTQYLLIDTFLGYWKSTRLAEVAA